MLYLPLLPLSRRGNARTFVLVMLCHVILTVFTLKKGRTSAINAPSHTWGLEDWLNTELSTQVNTTISVTYVASKLLQLLVCLFSHRSFLIFCDLLSFWHPFLIQWSPEGKEKNYLFHWYYRGFRWHLSYRLHKKHHEDPQPYKCNICR